jgi:hypothetical protein
MHGSLIWYYKSIPDFKQLEFDDQILLIKSNLLNIIHLHHIIIQNFQDNPKIGEHMSKWIDPDFHRQMSETRRYFYRFTKYPLLLKLTLIVFIFTMNLSIPDGSSQYDEYKNRKKINEYQNHYTIILWNYLTHLFEEKDAIRAMEIIVTQILRYQKLMMIMKRFVQHESKHDVLHSLMQSIFGLT